MDRFEAMEILVAIADSGSMSSASRKLKIPLATVSRKVAELESHLKVKLVTRTTRALEFTDDGLSYVAHCRKILEDVSEGERMVTGEYMAPKGLLTITAPIVFGKIHVIPILADFLKAYPDVSVQLLLTDRGVDLLKEKIDLALRIVELPSSSLIATRVGEIRHVTCGSPEYFKLRGRPKTPQELEVHDCVNISILHPVKSWTFGSGKSKFSVHVSPRLNVTTSEAGLEATALGLGITRALSYQLAGFLQDKRLEVILKDFEPDPWPVHLVHTSGKVVPLKLRTFLDFATPRLKERLRSIDLGPMI